MQPDRELGGYHPYRSNRKDLFKDTLPVSLDQNYLHFITN